MINQFLISNINALIWVKGAVLLLEDIAVARGANQLLHDIQWSVQRNERWGIVGPNGKNCV